MGMAVSLSLGLKRLSNHMKTCNTCNSCKTLNNELSEKRMKIDSLKNIIEVQEKEIGDLKDQLKKFMNPNISEKPLKAPKPLYIANSLDDLCKSAENRYQKYIITSNIQG